MSPRISLAAPVALWLAFAAATPVQANWQNAFQVTCFRRSQPAVAYYYAPPAVANYAPVTANYADPCCQPCAPPAPVAVATTNYIQRTCYQPVTTYQCQKYYEPVTTYQASYYYEPVTTCRYTCAYDPCSCSYRYVAQRVTSYYLRSKCCPVTTQVEKTRMVPVTTYRATTYYEPQTSYTWVDPCSGRPISGGTAPAPAATVPPAVPAVPAPSISEQSNKPPSVQESRSGSQGASSPLYQPPTGSNQLPQAPTGSGSSYRPTRPQQPMQFKPKMDRITSLPMNSQWTPARLAKHIIVDE